MTTTCMLSQKGKDRGRTILHTHSPQLESHLVQLGPYSHSSFHKESLVRTSPYLPAIPSRDPERQWHAAMPPRYRRSGPRLAAPLPPPTAISFSSCRVALPTHLRQGHPSPPADGVTELSCRSGESICQEIMIMNHTFHNACHLLPFSYIRWHDGFQEEEVFMSFLSPLSLEGGRSLPTLTLILILHQAKTQQTTLKQKKRSHLV